MRERTLNLDDFKKKINSNSNYLTWRFVIYLGLTLVSINGLYDISNINSLAYFNNIVLYSAPLFIEYIYGLNCYTKRFKNSKTIGFIISLLFLAFGILGLIGISTIEIDKHTLLIKELYLYKGHISVLIYIKYIFPFILCSCILADCIFSYNFEEIRYYNLISELNEDINERLKKEKEKENGVLEKEKKGYKDKYRKQIKESIKGNY